MTRLVAQLLQGGTQTVAAVNVDLVQLVDEDG